MKYFYERAEKPIEKVFWILAVSAAALMAVMFCYRVSIFLFAVL